MRILTKIIRQRFSMSKFDANKDYYKSLNLSTEASQQQVKKSFKQLAKKYHPDANKGKQELFKQINEAYQVLSEVQTRKDYDQIRKQAKNTTRKQSPFSQNQDYQRQQQQNYNTYYSQKPYQDISESQFRQKMRRHHQEMMKRATKNRQNFDDLGRGYENYQRFAEDLLRKRAENFTQKDKVTQQSVRRQQEIKSQARRRRQEQQFNRKRDQLQRAINQKYERAMHNNQKLMDGIKQMGQFVKNIFKKK